MIALASAQESEETTSDTLGETADTALVIEEKDGERSDTLETAAIEPVALALEQGYKSLPWGTTPEKFSQFVRGSSMDGPNRKGEISVDGRLGEDSVHFVYSFSDKGFWKVRIDHRVRGKKLDDYIDHFSRIERVLSKRYGSPVRTTQNEMGTDQEYLFSDFPKLSRAYFRSSWISKPVRIELLLEAVTDRTELDLPVFDDLLPLLRLYYYHPDFYSKTQPDTSSGVSEETLLDAY